MKIILVIGFICFSFASAAFSGLPQRIIIQFEQPLSLEQQKEMHQSIDKLTSSNFVCVETSTNKRWILEFKPKIDQSTLKVLIEKIRNLNSVKYVELDSLMQHTSI